MSRFVKGQSGNPNGRPRSRRPNVSAFDIIIEKRLTASRGGVERELTVDEALQMQTYNDALKAERLAVRSVLKMIERREGALQAKAPKVDYERSPVLLSYDSDSDSANEAMLLLDTLCRNPEQQIDR